MESIQNFGGGLDKDTNPLNLAKGKYTNANNIRILNDVGATSFSINNIKGNEFNIAIPGTPQFSKIEIVGLGSGTLTINGEFGAAFATTGMTPQDLYNYIHNTAAYTKEGVEYDIYYGNSYIILVPRAGFSITLSQSATYLSLTTLFIPAQSNLHIIGSVNIRDDIYLFTTNNTTRNPGRHDPNLTADAPSIGQIWKYVYNKITLAGTITLIYNGFIDFSTYYNIPTTGVTGRYENGSIQRIYWTDNFNTLRTLNVADPQALAISPIELNIIPAVDFDIPRLESIYNAGGSVLSGVYQCAYRLTNTGGALTSFSTPSNPVYVVPNNELDNTDTGGDQFDWRDYIGGALHENTTKQITWTIPNIDQDFDRIQIIVLYRERPDDPATIFQMAELPISNTSISFVFTGTAPNGIPVTLEEYTIGSGLFTICKTIETKDNKLFIANIKNNLTEISKSDFDARAFRSFTSGAVDIRVENNGTPVVYTTIASAAATAETADMVNKYHTVQECKYKPGTAILGGAGTHVSYEFYTTDIAADIATTTGNDFVVPDNTGAPWRYTNPRFFGTLDYTLDVNSITNTNSTEKQRYPLPVPRLRDGFKYPHITGLYRGYQRGEVYRFGIQFFDKSKNPLFVKWIGDIKMPEYEDSNPNRYYEDGSLATDLGADFNDFRLSYNHPNKSGQQICFVRSLGIKFTITGLDTVSDKIDGYTIVRTKRESKDKTIVAQGYIKPVDISDVDNDYYTTRPFNVINPDGNNWRTYPAGNPAKDKAWFISPEILKLDITLDSSMRLKGYNKLMQVPAAVDTVLNGNAGGAPTPISLFKMYNWTIPSTVGVDTFDYGIDQIINLGYNGTGTDNVFSIPVNNYDYATGANNESQAMCNQAFYIRVDTANITYPPSIASGFGGMLLCNIERSLPSQYGGSTYTARSGNTYISCNHYRPIRTTGISFTDTFEVYGGDTFVNMYDSVRWTYNMGSHSNRAFNLFKYSSVFIFAVESTINTDLRRGFYLNKNITQPLTSPGPDTTQEFVERYEYNTVYSAENDINLYYPKPDPFLSNDEFDNRVYWSGTKINGEFVDSWGTYNADDYWDVEGTYGPITAMQVLRDRVYFWQDRSFGTLEINPRAIVTDTSQTTGANTQLQLSIGNVIQRHDYISTEFGLQHQNGLTWSGESLYWLDVNNKKFFQFKGGITPLSDVKGMFSFFNNSLTGEINNIDKPTHNVSFHLGNPAISAGIRAVFDYKYNQAIFTISDYEIPGGIESLRGSSYTLSFDENLNSYTSFYGYQPLVYFTDGNRIFSENHLSPTLSSSRQGVYMHDAGDYGRFYDILQPSTISLIVNDNFQYTKVFDNITFDSEAINRSITGQNLNNDTWNRIRVYNDYQNTDYQTLTVGTNIKRKERSWQLHVPRNRVLYTVNDSPDIFTDLSPSELPSGERMRSKYINIDLEYNNTDNRAFTCNNFRTIYRGSTR